MMTNANETHNTQRRAICPACFAEQAINTSGRLVAHGYTRPQHWNANIGTCSGAGRPHFGTEAGRNETASIAARLRDGAVKVREAAAGTLAGTVPVRERKRVAGTRVYTMAVVENPSEALRARAAQLLEQNAAGMIGNAIELEAAVAKWAPAEPRIVTVEKKVSLVHFRSRHAYGGGNLCAGSAMASHRGQSTSEREHVTCPKCMARFAYHDRREAERAAAAAKQ